MKWKLSVGVSSSTCRSLNSPYITALVSATDPSGAVLTKSFEMTIGEFKVMLLLWTSWDVYSLLGNLIRFDIDKKLSSNSKLGLHLCLFYVLIACVK